MFPFIDTMLSPSLVVKKGEKISVSCFFGKLIFLTHVNLKFYQKSNVLLKNNLFSVFSRKYFTKKSKNNSFLIKRISTCFIASRIFF